MSRQRSRGCGCGCGTIAIIILLILILMSMTGCTTMGAGTVSGESYVITDCPEKIELPDWDGRGRCSSGLWPASACHQQ